MYRSIWLFRFISYAYCQGTKDKYLDMKLISFTLPCEEWEAEMHLKRELRKANIEFDEESIESLTIFVTNS